MKKVALAFLLLCDIARAGGGSGLVPLGVPVSLTTTVRCQSGRTIPTFSPNTQSIRLVYRGELKVLMYMPNLPGQDVMNVGVRYSDIARPGERMFDLPSLGTGLEWRADPRRKVITLYRVSQDSAGKRLYTLLERCR